MLRFMLPLCLLTYSEGVNLSPVRFSAASKGQIKFALENKYDNTGPGANGPEHAYEAYKDVNEALIAYLDDPDTKLPFFDKTRAIAHLYKKISYFDNLVPKRSNLKINRPKIVPIVTNSFSRYNEPVKSSKYFEPPRESRYIEPLKEITFDFIKTDPKDKQMEEIDFQLDPPLNSNRVPWTYYTSAEKYNYKPHPDIEFLDTHDKETGDLKSAQELRDGSGAVHGYYSAGVRAGNNARATRVVHQHQYPLLRYT